MKEFESLKKATDETAADLIRTVKRIIQQKGRVSTGKMLRGFDYKTIETMNGFMIEIMAEDYFKYQDEGVNGTQKNWGSKFSFKVGPGPRFLDKWMVRKGIAPRDKNGKLLPRKSVRFLIARSINRNGIKPMNAMKDAIQEVMKRRSELMERASIEDIETFLDKIIKDYDKK